jgi:hypothetical protein
MSAISTLRDEVSLGQVTARVYWFSTSLASLVDLLDQHQDGLHRRRAARSRRRPPAFRIASAKGDVWSSAPITVLTCAGPDKAVDRLRRSNSPVPVRCVEDGPDRRRA